MANVAVRNWRFLHKMGMAGCRWFEGLGNYLSVRRMATITGDGRGIDPDAPTVLTIKVLYSQPRLPIAEQGKQGPRSCSGRRSRSTSAPSARSWATCLRVAGSIRGATWRESS